MTSAYAQKTYQKDDVIFFQGAATDGLYILRAGGLGVFMHPSIPHPKPDEAIKGAVKVGTLDTLGCFVGEGGIFLERRTATVVALTNGTVLEHIPIDIGGLKKVMLARPTMALTLCRNLARRLREMNSRMRSFSGIAEAVERSVEQYSIAFATLMQEAEDMQDLVPEMPGILAPLHGEKLYIQGCELLAQRRETSLIFAQHATHLRAGRMTVSADQVIIEEDKPGRGLYFIEKGEFTVSVGSLVLGTVGAGEIVGEISVLLKETPKRTASVRATIPGVVLAIPTLDFQEVSLEKPAILASIARMLANRLDRTNQLVCQQYVAAGNMFTALAGGAESCEAEFMILANVLAPVVRAGPLSQRAMHLAAEAAKRRNELLKQHGEELT